MILDTTSKSVTVVLGEATSTTQSDITAGYADITTSTFTPGSSDTVTNGTTPVTAVAAPPASTQRVIKEITIANRDSIQHTFRITLVNGANSRVFYTGTLGVGQSVIYSMSGIQGPTLGSMAVQNATSVVITGGSVTGITDLTVADGGTGASTASGARTNLGLGTIVTQDSSNVTITGGSISSPTRLIGTTTNNNATAGDVGELLSSNIVLGSAVSLTSGVAANVTSISVPAGDYDAYAVVAFERANGGTSWTLRASAADNQWLSVCWSPELTLFVAVAQTGTGNRVMTSPDGVAWTSRTSAADNSWRAVCWAPELSLFVAVANSGTGNRVMTSPGQVVPITETVGINTSSATLPTVGPTSSVSRHRAYPGSTGTFHNLTSCRISLASTTTVYLVALAKAYAGIDRIAHRAYGFLALRRRR